MWESSVPTHLRETYHKNMWRKLSNFELQVFGRTKSITLLVLSVSTSAKKGLGQSSFFLFFFPFDTPLPGNTSNWFQFFDIFSFYGRLLFSRRYVWASGSSFGSLCCRGLVSTVGYILVGRGVFASIFSGHDRNLHRLLSSCEKEGYGTAWSDTSEVFGCYHSLS